ncbi:MAG TPA: SMP-30/gluconolactonase/LRE family protein [Marinagarivorans sp.]
MPPFNRALITSLLALPFGGVACSQQSSETAQANPIFRSADKIACENSDVHGSIGDITFHKVAEIKPKTKSWGILEGPLWVNGTLLMSNVGLPVDNTPNPADLVMLKDGEIVVLKEDYGSNGLTLDQEGYVVAPRHKDGTITRVIDGQVLAGQYEGTRFNSPNDVVISSQGTVFFSDPDWQNPEPTQAEERMYQVTLAGDITAFGSAIEKPNGVMLSHDEQTLYAGGTNGLFKFSFDSNGKVIDEALQISAVEGGIDGMSRDCAGNLYVTNHKQVLVLANGTEELLKTFDFDSEGIDGVTNIAFGGADGKTIFVTTMGSKPGLWSAQSEIAGLPY